MKLEVYSFLLFGLWFVLFLITVVLSIWRNKVWMCELIHWQQWPKSKFNYIAEFNLNIEKLAAQ